MQIDFHHAVTYIVARLAGFDHPKANTIAHSAQYVDDATHDGTIEFDNGAQYTRIASAHKMLDYKNVDELAAHTSWLPFHFLPGNLGENAPPPDQLPQLSRDDYLMRCVCRPNSPIAQEMMQDVIQRQARPYSLHRLGIASHVYIDTWAHQGFVGYQHKINQASNLVDPRPKRKMSSWEVLKDKLGDVVDDVQGALVSRALPLGHGAVLSLPDRPYLTWSYTNGLGQSIKRDNPRDFGEAVRQLYQQYMRYRDWASAGPAALQRNYPEHPMMAVIDRCIRQITDDEEAARHTRWLALIADGTFGFKETLTYIAKGKGSWKHLALGDGAADEDDDQDDKSYPYTPAFLNSDWKRFHDALQVHRLHILNELLPRYGLTAA